jgi:hypothetical protein
MSDITLAISQSALQQAFGALVEVFEFETTSNTSGNPRFSLHVKCHLERGSFALVPPDPNNPIYTGGFIKLSDIVIAWDNLDLTITVHIPKIGWDSFCLLSLPVVGCVITIPGASFFDTDVSVTLPIDNLVRSRIDLGTAPLAHHLLDATTGKWQWAIVPEVVWTNIQPLDIADTVGDFIDDVVAKLVDEALSFLPDWAKDVVDAIVHGIASFVRGLLSLPADLISWLDNLLRVSLNPFDLIVQILVNHFQNDLRLYSIDDPMEILPKQTSPVLLPAVTIPIGSLDTRVDAVELVVEVTS